MLFQDSVELETASHSLSGHLDGTAIAPVPPAALGPSPSADEQTAYDKALSEYQKELEKWKAGDATIRKGLSEALPPTLYLTVRKEATAKLLWDAVVKHHQQKAQLIIVELRRKLQNEKCDEDGDLRAHLGKLLSMRDSLAQMAEVVSDDNFRSIILGSLPASYDNFLTSITNQISPIPYGITMEPTTISGITIPERQVMVTPPKISPDDLMEILGQEADRRALRAGTTKEEKDAAFAASSKFKGGKRGGKSNVECYNCGKRGHVKAECWSKGGGKEGQGPKSKGKEPAKKKETAATANDKATTDDVAWTAADFGGDDEVILSADDPFAGLPDDEIQGESESDNILALLTHSDSSESVSDAFEGLFEDEEELESDEPPALESQSDSSESDSDYELVDASDTDDEDAPYEWLRNCTNNLVVEDGLEEPTTTFEAAFIAHNCNHSSSVETELYDSGASRHMTPYRDRLENFVSIVPRPISAANMLSFSAIGRGDMWIDVPKEGGKSTKVLLKDVLYAPDISVTLISISKIASAGFKVLFERSLMKISNAKEKLVGEISVDGGLYYVKHSNHIAVAMTTISPDELHRRMGHISIEAAKSLVNKGLVEGITLDDSQASSPCNSCAFAKPRENQYRRKECVQEPKTWATRFTPTCGGPHR